LARAEAVVLPEVHPDDPAYLLYTSGSTGRPKAVVIAHRSVRAFFEAHNAFADIRPGDRCLNTGGFHFDVSVLDVLLPLYVGATVTLTPELLLPSLVLGLLERERITHVYAVGTVLARITGDGSGLDRHRLDALRMLQTGAERCSPHVVNAWLTRYPALGFLNSYGPTELTVGCLCYRKQEPGVLTTDDVPVGVVHAGSAARLVDEAGAPIRTPGQVGELLVSGAQMMRGYWNRPEEEQRVFVVIDGARHYRTGDRMFIDDDGRYHFVGRDDDCVKIEGVRLSLSEVERLLEERAEVQRAVAFVVRTGSRTRVAVAVQTDAAQSFALAEALRALAEAELPAIAVPIATLITTQLPRASSGKADVRLLATRTEAALEQAPQRAYRLDDETISPLFANEERPS
jgi:acyl-coenzyme A synthetase/AMP-(fatty) acid ligase